MLCVLVPEVIKTGDLEMVADILNEFALAAAGLGADVRVAQLLGYEMRMREEIDIPRPPPEAAILDDLIAPSRERLGPAEWERGPVAGRELTRGEVLVLAQQPIDTPS